MGLCICTQTKVIIAKILGDILPKRPHAQEGGILYNKTSPPSISSLSKALSPHEERKRGHTRYLCSYWPIHTIREITFPTFIFRDHPPPFPSSPLPLPNTSQILFSSKRMAPKAIAKRNPPPNLSRPKMAGNRVTFCGRTPQWSHLWIFVPLRWRFVGGREGG